MNKPINNEITIIQLFIGLALSESLNIILLYIWNMQDAYNPKPTDDVASNFRAFYCDDALV
jgi:hypothetical protein